MRRAMAVSMIPGWTIATRTLKGLTSWASPSLNASSANFEAVYAVSGEHEIRPATDETLTMQPFRLVRMSGSHARIVRMAPK